MRSKAISKPFYIRRKTEGTSLEFCMIAHDQRYALSINILLLPSLWLNDSELDFGSKGTGYEPCPRPSGDRRKRPITGLFFRPLFFFYSCIIFLSSRCFIPVCPSCVQIAYSKFCVSVVSSIDSGLQDRIPLPRTLKLFSASFHFKIRCNKRGQQFQTLSEVYFSFCM